MEEKLIFILRLVGREETSFRENVIGIGWSEARGLDAIDDWTAFKEVIRAAYPSYSNHGLGNVGSSIWNFIHGMKSGSIVIVPLPDGFKVAEVLDDAPYYDEASRDQDYAWRRKAKWLVDKPIPRNYASNLLQRKMKTQHTCLDITASQPHDDLNKAMRRTAPISFKSELYADATSVVFEHLLKSLTPTNLEHLIASIYRANGHHAVRQHTHQEEEGDIDVLVEIDPGLGQQSKPISIGIQVKQHEGVTDKYAVEQVAARLGEGGSLDRGIVVTTACDFDEDAIRLAAEHDVALVGREELATWVLDNIGTLDD